MASQNIRAGITALEAKLVARLDAEHRVIWVLISPMVAAIVAGFFRG